MFLTPARRLGFRCGFLLPPNPVPRERILRILAYALRFKVKYPGWRWPRDTEAETKRAAEAILEHIELSDCKVEAGAAAKSHSTHGDA